jgi:NAD(P)H dehydrogenase (quinone)
MILVTGAMGRIGSAAVRALHARGSRVRAMVPTRRRVPWLRELGITAAEGDYDDGRSLGAALEGVQTVVLIARASAEQVAVQERVMDACVSAGVRRIVKLSVAGAAPDAHADAARWHWRTEQHLQHAVPEPVVVRAVRLMQDLQHQVPLVIAHRMLLGCQGDGLVADVDARDVGEVLAAMAAGDTCPTEPVVVTGGELLSQPALTERLAQALRLPLRYVRCSPADLEQTLLASGLPRWQVQDLVAFEEVASRGGHAMLTEAVQQYTGHPPRTLAAFADAFATGLRHANAPVPPAHVAQVTTGA